MREKHSIAAHPNNTPLCLVGSTGAGKTATSLALAEYFNGEIINIDSMQLYRGMDVGTAKITPQEMRGIPHHLFDIWDVTRTASVAEYRAEAVTKAEELMNRGIRPIFVGGSMMYVQSLVDEWDFPPTDPDVRKKWEREVARVGVEKIHQHLSTIDPEAARIIENNDPRRTVRALEVIELTGKPFAASQPQKDRPTRWGMSIIGLATDPEWLNPRLEQRVHTMFDKGLVDEVTELQKAGLKRDSTAGQAIGYAQVLDYLAGEMDLGEAVEKTIIGTRRYARRQRSWFNRDKRIRWIPAAAENVTAQAIEMAVTLATTMKQYD